MSDIEACPRCDGRKRVGLSGRECQFCDGEGSVSRERATRHKAWQEARFLKAQQDFRKPDGEGVTDE